MKKSLLLSLLALSYMTLTAMPPAPGENALEPSRPHVRALDRHNNTSFAPARRGGEYASSERGLCILVNYTDQDFKDENTPLAFDSLANAGHYTYDGAKASVREYFREQSGGLYVPHFDIVGPVDLPRNTYWYGHDSTFLGDDRYVVDFVLDACYGAQDLGVDFSDYDADEDGFIDFVYIIYAGKGQADNTSQERLIWPHEWDIESALYYGMTAQDSFYVNIQDLYDERLPELNGKVLYRYACSNELRPDGSRTGVSTMCHEFSHVLGLPDYYITQGRSPMKDANEEPGTWSLMSKGSYNNNGRTPPNFSVYDKYYLGWITPTFLAEPQAVTLPADGQTYFAVSRNRQVPAEGALEPDTVWYIENRQLSGWDEYIPGHGLILWQVVYDSTMWADNVPNDYSTRYGVIAASGQKSYCSTTYVGGTRQDIPFPGSQNVTAFTVLGQKITSIEEASDGLVSFIYDLYTPSETCRIPEEEAASSPAYNILGQRVSEDYQGLIIRPNWKGFKLASKP